jgi:hypothetical protein
MLLLATASTSFAQRHFGRGGYYGGRSFHNDFRPYHSMAGCNVYFRPAFPRVYIRPIAPAMVVGYNNYRNYNEPVYDKRNVMTDADLCQINRTLQSFNSDNDKVAFLKSQIDTYFLTASQLSNLLYAFKFEENRLDLAKYGYRKTIDTQNYSIVYNTLSFNDSKHDLDSFIDNMNMCRR